MAAHPYYPLGVEIADYVPNAREPVALISIFAAACAVVFIATYLVTTRSRPQISTGDLLTAQWFVLCGCIHLILEGHYSLHFHRLPSDQSLLSQLWKEYSLSDSRYLRPNSFVHSMESVTAFCWGPLSFAIAYMISTDHPLRHPLQTIVSLGQLYGDVLYYATCLFEWAVFATEHSRPEPYYFWGYFAFLNAFWIVIPLVMLYNSVVASAKAFVASKRLQVNGDAKKVL